MKTAVLVAACSVPVGALALRPWASPRASDVGRRSDFDVLTVGSGSVKGPRVLFVGGNPGVARYYSMAGKALASKLDGDVTILGLRGFDEHGGLRASRWWRDALRWCGGVARGCFSVEAQIDNVATFVRREAALCDAERRSLVVVGHSIGGYFGFKAVERTGCDAITVGVSPYLQNDVTSDAFNALFALLHRWWAPPALAVVAAFASVLGWCPFFAQRRVLKALGQTSGMDDYHERLTCESMCAFGNVFTMAALGRSEMRVLKDDFTGPYPDALLLSDTPRDQWSPAAGPLVDRALAGGTDVQVLSDVPHAFSTAQDSRDKVVDVLAATITAIEAERRRRPPL